MDFNIKKYNYKAVIRIFCSVWLSLSIIFASFTISYANTPIPSTRLSSPTLQAIENSTKAVKALERIRGTIDMKTTSIENMAEFLNFDPDAAVKYVTNEIDTLTYLGSMRGPIGAMETGSASVLDQALLLGGLLDLMGLDVVLAHGQLNSEDTNRLMVETLNVNAPESAIDTVKINQLGIPKSAARESQEQKIPSEKSIDIRLKEIADTLIDSLEPQTKSPLNAIKADVSENYIWVRYRGVPSNPWIDVHPAFAKAASPSPIVKSYSQVEVPKGRSHTFGFKLILEVTEKNKARETILAHFKPVLISELAKQQIDLTLVPSGMNPTNITRDSKASYFRPMINGESPKDAKAFSSRGVTVAVDVVTSEKSGAAAASLFGNLTTKLELGDPESLADQPHVTGLWIEAVYKNPLGKKTRRRTLIDLSASKPGDLVSATDAMLRTVIDFNIGQTNLARKIDYQANTMISQVQRLPYITSVASGNMTMEAFNNEPKLIGVVSKETWMGMATMQDLYLPTRYEEQVVLPLTALISTLTTSIIPSKDKTKTTTRKVLDLMFTDTLILKDSAITLEVNREALMRLGIFRTIVETVMLNGDMDMNPLTRGEGKLTAFNNEKTLLSLIKESGLDTRTSERLIRDFKSAGTVLISEASGNGDLRWWKIDQTTGEALGMGVLGGQTAVYAAFVSLSESNAVSAAFFVIGVWSCAIDSAVDAPKLNYKKNVANFKTCLVVNAAGYVIGGHFTALKTAQANLVAKIEIGFFVDVFSMALGSKVNSLLKSAR